MKTMFAVLARFIVRIVLALPTSWKIALSGGKPLEIAGRTLDPDAQLLDYLATKSKPVHKMAPEEAQKKTDWAETTFADTPVDQVDCQDFDIPSRADHRIPVRIYLPKTQVPGRPMMAYFHMGGGVIGSLQTGHVLCTMLARAIGCPILSVDYRLAPQHKYPSGLEDCLDAYEWTLKNAETYGAPGGRATIGGASMGGNFTAIIAQETRRLDIPMPDLQLLIYPATDINTPFASKELYANVFPLKKATMDWFMSQYLPEGADLQTPQMQPALEPRLEGLPSAVIFTAGFDILVDDGAAYAQKLRDAGVTVHYKCYDTLPHGFTGMTYTLKTARTACLEIADMTAKAYAEL